MMKKLLSASLFAAVALSASAYEVGEFAYTKTAKYKITGANLVVNGQFNQGASGTDGWTATDDVNYPLSTTFTMAEGGPNGSNYQTVLSGQTALAAGMYQVIDVKEGGAYVVSLKVMGATAGYTDLDMTGGNTNYINAYYNTDGVLATAKDAFGTDGVKGGYQFNYGTDGFTEVVFAVEAPMEGKLVIDLRGLAEGLCIADVCCHAAENVYDDRIANERIAYFQKYLAGEGMSERDFYPDFLECVEAVQAALAENADPSDINTLMENLEGTWEEFVNANFDNVIENVPTTDGSSNTGNNSANWMNWTGKWNKLNQYNGKAPWKFSTDRLCHKTGAAGTPIGVSWQRGASGNWNNIATLTVTLQPGIYFWGLSGDGGTMTLTSKSWDRTWANECAATQLFFNGDTTEVFVLSAARTMDYVYEYKLEEEKEVTLGFICNTNIDVKSGFDVKFYNPVLYRLDDGSYTSAQLAYLDAVKIQLEALAGRIAVAEDYIANDSLPWGRKALQAGKDEIEVLYNAWAALSDDDILAYMDNEEALNDTIMNNGVRALNNNYINPFVKMNSPFTNLLASISAAEAAKAMRIYSGSAKMADLTAEISKSQAMYDEKLKVAFSSEDSLALVNQKIALDDMVIAFKNAIVAEAIVDIDFGTQDVPAVFNEFVDPNGLLDTYYYVLGAKDTLKTSAIATGLDQNNFELGYGSTADENGAVVYTDSLGMLRVGNGEAVVTFEGAPMKSTDIVNIKFDYYFGNLSGKYAGFKVLSEAGDTICVFYLNRYNGEIAENTLGIDIAYVTGVGGGGKDHAAIAETAANRTSFDIVLDYGAKTMYSTVTSKNGTTVSAETTLPDFAPGQFVIYSNYNSYATRRCWFDNLKVLNIAAGAVEGGEGIESVEKAPVADGVMYNVAGLRIEKPVKGQLYIQNGRVKVAK